MRAIVSHRYGPPEVLQCEDVGTPTPADGEVLLAVRAASLNPADRLFEAQWPVLRWQIIISLNTPPHQASQPAPQ